MITFTPKAEEKVKAFLEDDENKGKVLRVYVEGGGCAGLQYGLAFDEKRDTDTVIACNGFDAVVDPLSSLYLKGTKIDFVESLYGTGFKFDNPNAASGGCGCAHGFGA